MTAITEEMGDKNNNYIFPIITKKMNTYEKYKKIDEWKRLTNRVLNRLSKYIDDNIKINLYSARHSYGNKMMINGVPNSHIQKGLGHANIKTTENYLGSLPASIQRKYASILTDFIEETPVNKLSAV